MMTTKIEAISKEPYLQKKMGRTKWQRVVLLIVLGYEAVGCLLGGSFLTAAPNGQYLDMPVDIMRGVFSNFLVPGIILLVLGILNTGAFFTVLKKHSSDWLMTILALGGLLVWFVVEIIIIQELHWLHLMWGFPVLLGWVVAMPLIVLRHDTVAMHKALLICGILSSLWYVAINIYVPMRYDGYDPVSLTVSELSAIGAPTRILWVLLVLPYPLLFAAFGWGVLNSSKVDRNLWVPGNLILAYSIANFCWPPIHQREIIAAGGGTWTDALHIVWAIMALILMMLIMGFGAAASGKRFRIYTVGTWAILIVFGMLTFLESPGIQANMPTPYMGLWERISIGAFMLWVIGFALSLLLLNRSRQVILDT